MSATNFRACLDFIKREEGGYTKDRRDPGNWTGGKVGKGELKGTLCGIAASSHPTLDIANLSKSDIERIYQREYWTPCGAPELPEGVDLVVFDTSVNAGVGRGKTYRTETMNVTDPATRVKLISQKRRVFYQGLKTFKTFGKTWLGRVARIEAAGVKMALVGLGMKPAEVVAELTHAGNEAKKIQVKANKQAAVPALTVASTPAVPDHSTLTIVALCVLVAALLGLVIYLVHRARAHKVLAEAYSDEAVFHDVATKYGVAA